MTIKRREGLMSIGIALMLLVFTIIATTVISNISSNLFKNIAEMDMGKEDQYKRIVIRSMKNALENNNLDFNSLNIGDSENVVFNYSITKGLVKSSEQGLVILYPATVTFISTDTADFFEVYTRQSTNTTGNDIDTYGIILQFDQNP